MKNQLEIYWQEFSLNLDHQLKDLKIKKPLQVGYQIDNYLLFNLLLPKGELEIW